LEHAVEFDLEELVQLVHLLLQLATERLGLLEVVAVCVDEDRIGITIDDLAIVFFLYIRDQVDTRFFTSRPHFCSARVTVFWRVSRPMLVISMARGLA